MEELISVLLPFYNAEDMLGACLESILQQTYPYFEVIAVDDGSTDDSSAVLAEFACKDHRIQKISFSQNRGIVAALNAGLDVCRGEWIARMDSDDRMHPDRLLLQLRRMKQHPEIDILGSQIRLFREKGQLSPGQIRYQDWSNSLLTDDEIKTDIYAESPIMHPTFFLSKRFYLKMDGYRDFPWPEDYDFLLRSYLSGAEFAKLPHVLVDKGDHPARLARTDARCKRKAMFQAKAHYFSKETDLILKKNQIVIVGSGSSGRLAYAALTQENVKVDAFVDNVSSSSGQHIAGLPVQTLQLESAGAFFSRHQLTFFILCIGLEEGRQLAEALLKEHGFLPVRDYLRFI